LCNDGYVDVINPPTQLLDFIHHRSKKYPAIRIVKRGIRVGKMLSDIAKPRGTQ
jgi:hypothetical protein